jgi:antitoxin YefM
MQRFTAEEATKDLSRLIGLTQQESRHFCITSGEGNAVLLSEETYHHLVVTLELLATPGLMEELITNNEDCEDSKGSCQAHLN